MPVGLPEFVDNPENRCPVVLLLDTSASMAGQPMYELNRGLATFKEDILKDSQASLSVEIAVVKFGGKVKLVQDFTTVDQFNLPQLTADGVTPMGKAIDYALDLVENRKKVYKQNGVQYYRPWVFMITDGAPTDLWEDAAIRLREAEANNRLLFFAVAVEGADMDTLQEIAPADRPPVLLNGLDFRTLFLWLSGSMKRVSSSNVGEAVVLPPVGWGKIST
jgi:uncharacterized protein YegL